MPPTRRPWYKRNWFIIGAALVVLLIVAGVLGNGGQPTGGAATQQTSGLKATETPTQETAGAAEPATTAAPEPAAPRLQTISGLGKTATRAFTVTDGITVFRLRHQGQANFIVSLLTSDGEDVDLLANVIGNFTGSTAAGLEAGRYVFNVEADGPWTIRIEQPRPTSGRSLPATVSGRGQSLAGPFQGTGEGARFELRHQGQENFIVELIDGDGQDVDLLANEIGSFHGSTISSPPEGVFWLKIQADDPWTVAMRTL